VSSSVERGLPVTHALWTKVHLLRVEELHKAIGELIEQGQHSLVLNVNAHCMNLTYGTPWFRKILDDASVVFCDGAGVALALRLWAHVHVPERITYASWTWQLAQFAEEHEYRLYFIGGKPGVAAAAARKLCERFKSLQIAGTHHGYFEKRGPENDAVVAEIARTKPHILVAGFGMPIQERWLAENISKLNANVLLSGGAVFDFISGDVPRGPRLLVDNGFEWLARLVRDPRRLWRRYVIGNPVFMYRAWRWTRAHKTGI
jgi:N-acetylglucosaminyldiphosphoundecaprenol N-acetyl-beta-D-mannosaminyltransferase